jgi:hypothetical protein
MPLPKNPKAQAFEHSNAEKFGQADHPAHPDHPDHPVHPETPPPPPPEPEPEINIIRDDPTTDTILHGTAGSDIFVFDASAMYSSTRHWLYGSMISDSIVDFDPAHDQIALVNFEVQALSSFPESVVFGTNFNTATVGDSQIVFSKPGLLHEINIDTMLDPSTLHLYANDPYANLSSVPVPPPSPEPNVIRDNPASYWVDRDYLYGTDGPDVFVFDAASAPTSNGRGFIVGFDPIEDRIALVNVPDYSGSVSFDEASSINWQENETTPFDGRVVWMQSNGQARYVQTVDVSPIDPSLVDFYHGDPFVIMI